MPTLSDLAPSIIRTVVPMAVGAFGSWEAAHLGWTPAQESAYTTVAIGGLYYLIVRLLEHAWPSLGVLLGVPVAPTYNSAELSAAALSAIDAAVRATVADFLSAQSAPQAVSRTAAPPSAPTLAPQPASAPAPAADTVQLSWAELTQTRHLTD